MTASRETRHASRAESTGAAPLRRQPRVDWFLIACIGLLFAGYILLHDLTGATLLAHNVYDSYSLQALAWLNGDTALPQNYSWLELAQYNGQVYVSFPPVPSVFMLPLVAVFGEETPSNLVIAVVAIATVAVCYECFLDRGTDKRSAMFWAVFYVMGSNMLWMSTKGGVWFLAQGFNLFLCTAALWAYLRQSDVLAMALAALAVGCRPFSVCLCAALLILIWHRQVRQRGKRLGTIAAAITLAIPAAIAVAILAYNYVRFDNPLEFGHNYLPEFLEAGEGQFSLSYVGQNAFNLFIFPVLLTPELGIDIPAFDGFMFYIANPLFFVAIILLIRDAIHKKLTRADLVMLAACSVNMFLLLLHKTLGGWQFGARYTVDLLPYALFLLLRDRVGRPNAAELLTGIGAVMFNVYGVFYLIIRQGFV